MRRSLALSAIVAVTASAPPVAEGAFPGRNGRISYVADTGNLVSVEAGGGRDRVLMRAEFDELWASDYSPDGRTIVLDRRDAIWIKQVIGRKRFRRLTRHFDPKGRLGRDVAPNWSPDGKSVVFVRHYSFRDDADQERVLPPRTGPCAGAASCIQIYHRGRTSAVTKVTSNSGDVAWSVRNRIAFLERSGWISVVRPDGSGRRRLVKADAGGDTGIDWSPDGRRLVFVKRDRLMTIGAAGGPVRRLGRQGAQPAFSPDGRRIVYFDPLADAREQLYTVDRRGLDLHVVRTRYEVFQNLPMPLAWQPLPRQKHP